MASLDRRNVASRRLRRVSHEHLSLDILPRVGRWRGATHRSYERDPGENDNLQNDGV